MTDLSSRIREVVERRKALAEAATPGPWRWGPLDMTPSGKLALMGPGMTPIIKAAQADVWPQASDAHFIAANNPADTLAECRAELDLIRGHEPEIRPFGAIGCRECRRAPWPCALLINRAERWGVSLTEEANDA